MDFHRRPGCPFQFLVRFSGSPLRIKHLKNSSHATSSAKSDQYSHTVQLKKRTIHTQKLAGSSPVVPTKIGIRIFSIEKIRIFLLPRNQGHDFSGAARNPVLKAAASVWIAAAPPRKTGCQSRSYTPPKSRRKARKARGTAPAAPNRKRNRAHTRGHRRL